LQLLTVAADNMLARVKFRMLLTPAASSAGRLCNNIVSVCLSVPPIDSSSNVQLVWAWAADISQYLLPMLELSSISTVIYCD